MITLREFIERRYSDIPTNLPLNEDFDPIPADAKHEGFYRTDMIGPHKVQISYLRSKRYGGKYHTVVHVNGKLHKEDNPNITPEDGAKITRHVKDQHFRFLNQRLAGGHTVVARGNTGKKSKVYNDLAGRIAKKAGYRARSTIGGGAVKFTPMPAPASYTPPKRDTYKNEPYDDSDVWKAKSKKWKFFSKKSK